MNIITVATVRAYFQKEVHQQSGAIQGCFADVILQTEDGWTKPIKITGENLTDLLDALTRLNNDGTLPPTAQELGNA